MDNASKDDSIEKIKDYCDGKIVAKSIYVEYSAKDKPINIKEIDYSEDKQFISDKTLIGDSKEHGLIFIKNDKNYGFAEGNNIAIQYALKQLGPEYVLLLNNDTVVDEKFLDELIDVAVKKEKIGFVGPKIYYYTPNEISNIISFAGGYLNINNCQPHPRGVYELDNGQFDEEDNVDYLEGSCLLVKSELINDVGLLDPDYFTYWEETDWCLRGQVAGYDSVYAPRSSIYHKGRASDLGSNSIYYMIKNRFLFTKKNQDIIPVYKSSLYYFGYYFWIILFSAALIHRDKDKCRSLLKGTYEGIKIISK